MSRGRATRGRRGPLDSGGVGGRAICYGTRGAGALPEPESGGEVATEGSEIRTVKHAIETTRARLVSLPPSRLRYGLLRQMKAQAVPASGR